MTPEKELLAKFYEDIKEPACPYPEGSVGRVMFDNLGEEIYHKAVTNTIKYHKYYKSLNADATALTIGEILDLPAYSFNWVDSIEGASYWTNVWNIINGID